MTDDRIDDLVDTGVKQYNEPPAPGAVPRDAMWERIQAVRRAERDVPRSTRHSSGTARRLWIWSGAAVAAAALLAIGIGVGRRMERRTTGGVGATTQVAAAAAAESASTTRSASVGTAASLPTVAAAPDSATRSVIRRLHRETMRAAQRARELAIAPRPTDSAQAGADALEYRLVLLQHLAGAEAMITVFRASARQGGGTVDAQLASWSRELVSTTRMLEASSAASDPVMKRLLEDLDLVLTEISHYAGTGTYQPEDLAAIEHAITQRGVMPRLRNTIPTTTPRVPVSGT